MRPRCSRGGRLGHHTAAARAVRRRWGPVWMSVMVRQEVRETAGLLPSPARAGEGSVHHGRRHVTRAWQAEPQPQNTSSFQ
ncbi:hypothetical protein CBM2591_B120154 [Cupriavidus taiwanensis]|nr:hypothetical protein CBM2591_B120154 [Cupriavidus taiwanensis]